MVDNQINTAIADESFLKAIPKTDLHVHMDGSLRLSTLVELARQQNVTLPSFSEEGLHTLVFKDNYNSLDEYLKGFAYTCSVLRDKEAIERVAYELAVDNQEEGVRYIEVRFAPQLFMNAGLTFEEIMSACNRGLERAKNEFNARDEVRAQKEPHFNYGIIVCAMRFFTGAFSPFYDAFYKSHQYSESLEIINLASQELVKAAVNMVKNTGIPIVGVDLAGSEAGYPAENHRLAYNIAHSNFLHKTVHAGEAYGPESIFQAITILHADRIGHGFYLFDDTKVFDEKNRLQAKTYVKNLVRYIANKRITLEVCPTSNLQTNPELKQNIRKHPFGRMMEETLSVTVCTDNRLVSKTTVTNELALLLRNFPLTLHQLKNIITYGFKRSFYPGSYTEKRQYVRDILVYFDKIVNDNKIG